MDRDYCFDCASTEHDAMEHKLIEMMTRPVDPAPDASLVGVEATRLGELIQAWLYDIRIGYTPSEDIQKLVQMIQDNGYRVD